MNLPSPRSWIRRLSKSFVTALSALAFVSVSAVAPAHADGLFDHPKYASIVVDANTGEVLYALRADAPRVPASITKILTLYLTFEALETGRVKLSDPVTVSAHAASMIPSKSPLRPGEQLTIDEAIRVVAILSANDIAVALGEHLAGSEQKFAALMTLRAQELGMTGSRFVNASGVPDPGNRQTTTARDIAILSRAVMRDYPQYYSYFSQATFDFRGRHLVNHNHLLLRMPGVDGLKTGFTNAAGFNLAASALRDGRRLITVVLGGSSTAARDENVEDLLSAGFSVLQARQHGQNITLASALNAPDEMGAMVRPATEMGSGDQGGLRVAAADPMHLPGSINDAMLAPVALQPGAIRTATHQECEHVRLTTMVKVGHHRRLVPHTVVETRCHQSSAPMRSMAAMPVRSETHTVVAAATPNCSRLKGRAKSRCQGAAASSESRAVAVATPQCDKVAGKKARASCRRIEGESASATRVASASGKTCTGKGRHRVCHAAASDEGVTVASAKLRGCSGKAAHSKACRAETRVAAASSSKHGKAKSHTARAEATPAHKHHVARAG